MTVRRPNRTGQALGLFGAVLVVTGSTVGVLSDDANWLDWSLLVGGFVLLAYWIREIVRGPSARGTRDRNGSGGQVDE